MPAPAPTPVADPAQMAQRGLPAAGGSGMSPALMAATGLGVAGLGTGTVLGARHFMQKAPDAIIPHAPHGPQPFIQQPTSHLQASHPIDIDPSSIADHLIA